MSYRELDLNGNWKLGWYPDTEFNRWITVFNHWECKNGALCGNPTQLTRAFIYANCNPQVDYRMTCRFSLDDDSADVRIVLCHSNVRLSGYYLVFYPGQKPSIYYCYSDLYEKMVAEGLGTECQAEHEYVVTSERKGKKITVTLDGELLTEFEATEPCDNYTALTVNSGSARFYELTVESAEGELLFHDEFLADSLPKITNVEYEGLHSEQWIDAQVPCTVQTALLEAGVIKDPYQPFQGALIHWMDDQRWIFKKKFTVPADFKGKRLRLLFDGVDYRAFFWLNGMYLCYHEGMFGGPELDVTDLVNYEAENELTVCILPCPNPAHSNVRPYIFHRWHFNMDIVTAGLWRGVRLIADDIMFLSDPQVVTKSIKDGTATVELSVTVSTLALWPFELKGSFVLTSPLSEDEPITVPFNPGFCQGTHRVRITVQIPNARLWWTAGMGEQYLYQVDISADLNEILKTPTLTAHDELHLRTGIRTFQMLPLPRVFDSEERVKNNIYGLYNWRCAVNGRAFFAKGSNWMPIDNLLRLDKEHYCRLLTRAVDANINMLRPWGAGLIETNEFYDLCDELGIMVWQETLFANGLYDESDLLIWRETIRRSVCRIRNHPSLAIWCGGNEFDPDMKGNKEIVDEVAAIIHELDADREFHRACPYGGDNHSYNVNWMGAEPYSSYTKDLSVAVTEFSLASPPCMDTLRRMIPEQELAAFPPDTPENIQRCNYHTWGREGVERKESRFSVIDAHLSGIEGIMYPPMSECGIPTSMDEFVTYLQTAHGLLTQYGYDVWRSRWPYCTMAMSWVFNVVFPDSMSWSYVDYFEMPKRAYYYMKHALERVHITALFDDLFNPAGSVLRVRVTAINENLTRYENCTARVRLFDSRLQMLSSEEYQVNLRADDLTPCGQFSFSIPPEVDDQVFFLCADLTTQEGELLSCSVYCPRVGKSVARMPFLADGPYIADVKQTRTTLSAKLFAEDGSISCVITNEGTVPAFQVYLHAPNADHVARYSDNCLWLEAGQSVTVRVSSFDQLPSRFELSAWNADTVALELSAQAD